MTVSAIPYAVLALIIFGLALVALGAVVDELILTDIMESDMPGLPYSEQRGETGDFLLMCFGALPFVGVFCVVIFLLMNGAQRGSGGI
ncbi:MAG: hypothetical protein LLF90_03845 [Methanomicrobiaceae archaeon]|nr:hypothetical protein [Methanomicrobiaceae archaeon]